MRSGGRVTAMVVALLTLAPAAGAGEVTSLQVTGGTIHRLGEGRIELTGTASFAGDPTGPVQVLSDPEADGRHLGDAVPPYQDLVAGFMGERVDARDGAVIDFTWRVVDLPDNPVYTPADFYWEFTLGGASFVLIAGLGIATGVSGTLFDCTSGDCAQVAATVRTAYDGAGNSVRASVRRRDLKRGGVILARDGAILQETNIFDGIASYTRMPGFFSGPFGDQGDMDRPYVLGPHVEAALVPAGFGDAEARSAFGNLAAVAGPGGAFAVNVPFETGQRPGSYDAIAQACTGGHCGPLRRVPVQLVR